MEEQEPTDVTCLTVDLLAACLTCLDPTDLASAEASCRRFRAAVAEHALWRASCERLLPSLSAIAPSLELSQLPPALAALPPPGRASAAHKRLRAALGAPPARRSLLARALAATSVDNPEESPELTLNPTARTRRVISYWSSAGSPDAGSVEALSYRLAHPLCLVTGVQLRPYRAWFQPGQPVYAPQRLRVHLSGPGQQGAAGGSRDGGAAPSSAAPPRAPGPGHGGWTSREFAVAPRDALQTFAFPSPVLCAGGVLRLELLGRTRRQQADGLYYTCVCYARALGTPLPHFLLWPAALQHPFAGARAAAAGAPPTAADSTAGIPIPGPGWRLSFLRVDPLQAAGGLEAASEGGRYARAAAARRAAAAAATAHRAVIAAALAAAAGGAGPGAAGRLAVAAAMLGGGGEEGPEEADAEDAASATDGEEAYAEGGDEGGEESGSDDGGGSDGEGSDGEGGGEGAAA